MSALELNHLYLEPRHLALLQHILHQQVPQAEVWAYGSRVTGGAHETSDLDLVLRAPADPKAEVAGYLALKEALQASTLPITVDVQSWWRLPESFQQEIERGYMVLQTGKPI